ncbi:MAG: magnesium/cobalt transporter CorA [Sedimentisphaerales bacterium]|nr:magnesium/cobalt transporter CorA [Sedimentisphaerales bacterium]
MGKRQVNKSGKSRLIRKRSKKAGLPPGTLITELEQTDFAARMSLLDYDQAQITEKEIKTVKESYPFKDLPTVTWLNIDGPSAAVIEELGTHFNMHPLIQEDILTTGQRPKCEEYEDHLFVVLEMMRYDEQRHIVKFEQVSLVVGNQFVLSFQEEVGDVFDAVRERIRSAKGRVRKMGADYLAYALIDAIVDHYFLVLEKLGEQIEDLETRILGDSDVSVSQEIHRLKRELSLLRRSVWPLREVLSNLQRTESYLIQETTRLYLRDVYDHTIQVIDTIETFRDMVAGLLDLYLAAVSNRMNAVMKVLTVIATIFIPLSFFAGVYGMNFEQMPELQWRWAYPLGFWSVIVIAAGSMLLYFKRRKWL